MLVVLETPWAGLGAGEKAKTYLRACIRDVLARGEIPWSAHATLSWTSALYDADEEQRAEGLDVKKRMILCADILAIYTDKNITNEMQTAITWARMHGKKVDMRRIY
jgi:hypothetical protein